MSRTGRNYRSQLQVLSRDVVDFSVDETMVKYEATARLAHGLEPISYWGVQRILLQLSRWAGLAGSERGGAAGVGWVGLETRQLR